VRGIFQWEFVVLLLDVSLVITYFILVRTIEFGKEGGSPRIDPPSTVAFWLLVIFALYFIWDVITKIVIYRKKPEGQWLRKYGSRMLPTIVCLILACIIRRQVRVADLPHYLSADFALFWLVLFFRASKDLVSACIPKHKTASIDSSQARVAVSWTVLCIAGITLGLLATTHSWSLPIPESIVNDIQTTPLADSDKPRAESTKP
jgi:hypothetical protein